MSRRREMRGFAFAVLGAAALLEGAAGCSILSTREDVREETRDALAAGPTAIDARALSSATAPLAPTFAASAARDEDAPAPTDGREAPGAPVTGALDLARASALAVETSERIRAAGEQVHQARLQRIQAVATLLPSFDFRSTYFRQENDFPTAAGTGGAVSRFFLDEQRTSRFTWRQPLFRLSSFLAVSAAASVIGAAEARLEAERLLVASAAAALFFETLTLERRREAFRAGVERSEARLREVRGRVEGGLARRSELLFVETDRSRAKASLADATERALAARERLSLVVGAPVVGPLVEPALEAALTPATLAHARLEDLVVEAVSNRPDLRALREDAVAQAGLEGVAAGAFAPTVDLSGNLFTHRDGNSEEVDWDLSLDVVVPIFEGFGASARWAEARSRKRESQLRFEAEGRALAADVAQAWRLLRAASEAKTSRDDAVRAASESYRALEAEYGVGLATNLELVTALEQLTSATVDAETTRLDEARLAAELGFLLGRARVARAADPN